jgi:outer membrane receptor protein involved in Fe transport
MLLGATALQTFAACGIAFIAAPALAQEVPPPTTTEQEAADPDTAGQEAAAGTQEVIAESAQEGQAIVVTGSRIRRPNLESQVPVTSISGESFLQQSTTSIGDTLNELPQLRSTFAQSNPGLGIGIAGLNLLDLRGLGTVRTLTLVNGRRHVGADILNNAVSPDVNTIPNDLVERVDIVTGGNSAVYGSDAIAGVVNFVLKRDFSGLQVRGNAAVSQKGFGQNEYVSAMYGHNFGDGRGNVTVHGEYAHQDRIFASDIPWLRSQDGFLVVDVDTAGLPNGSDDVPDRTFFEDIRSASINRFGLIPINQRPADADCGTGLGATNGPASTVGGSPYNCTFIFDEQGNLLTQTGTRVGTGIIGSIVGGNGQTGREDELLSVLPKMTRYNFNALAHYTISDAFEPFIEAKWVRVKARGSNFGPSFIQGQQTQFDFRERVRIDNPFLTPAQRTTIANSILASSCNTSLTAACPDFTDIDPGPGVTLIPGNLTAAQQAQIAAGTYRFVIARHLADSGIRDEEFKRDTYRIVGGLRGNFNEDWNYEISVNYGKMKEDTATFGFMDKQRFMLAMDSGIDPLNPGAGIQCRAKFDPAAAVPFPNNPANVARLAADIAACVPYNPFGGADNSAAANYFVYNARNKAWMSQLDILGFVAGDSSQLFELPGGPVRFVIGGEYRKEKNSYTQDQFVADGFTNGVSIGDFDPDPFTVKEAYAEIQIPILKDEPFFEDLTLSGAGRLSWYGGAIGTVKTYNAGLEWSPVRDIRFRANYGRAIRAPNVSETGFPVVPNFAPGFIDPCQTANLANNPNRPANCAADLGAFFGTLPSVTISLPILSGSNPDLLPEESDSYTVGAVIQPRWIPGLSVSVDWYKINVNNVIVSLSAQAIVNGCYDAPTLSNPFCGLFQRWQGPGAGPFGEVPGQVLGNSLLSGPQNFAKRVRKGIDTEVAYRTTVGPVKLDTRLIYTHNIQISNFQDPTFLQLENRILGELGDPQDEFRWDVALTHGPFTLGYQMSYIGKMAVSTAYEDQNEAPGACNPITGACPPFNADFADDKSYPAVFYHDIRLDYNIKSLGGIGKDYLFFVGVDNFTNKKPPLGTTATGAGSAIYNVLGRRFFAGFRARF